MLLQILKFWSETTGYRCMSLFSTAILTVRTCARGQPLDQKTELLLIPGKGKLANGSSASATLLGIASSFAFLFGTAGEGADFPTDMNATLFLFWGGSSDGLGVGIESALSVMISSAAVTNLVIFAPSAKLSFSSPFIIDRSTNVETIFEQ